MFYYLLLMQSDDQNKVKQSGDLAALRLLLFFPKLFFCSFSQFFV